MFDKVLKAVRTSKFSEVYIVLNEFIFNLPDVQKSRYGDTKEMMDVKVELFPSTAGFCRCVGGGERNINIFFLLAEAMWIWAGRKDVDFLLPFNSKMGEFSDNGETFHAPYGWRMRYFGRATDALGYGDGDVSIDQIETVVRMLSLNPDDRRAVISIWNPAFDLAVQSKDIPCNDLLMFKVRDGALFQSIANRSNDLHWGLPTNVFQFSFVGELIAQILGVQYGRQTHNIHSLHLYTNNPIAAILDKANRAGMITDLYEIAVPLNMSLELEGSTAADRMHAADRGINRLLEALEHYRDEQDGDLNQFLNSYANKSLEGCEVNSAFFSVAYHLLLVYLDYWKKVKAGGVTDEARLDAIRLILALCDMFPMAWKTDIIVLALNFFVIRLKDKSLRPAILNDIIGTL